MNADRVACFISYDTSVILLEYCYHASFVQQLEKEDKKNLWSFYIVIIDYYG